MKLQALIPCERVIRDAVGGPSLIATFQEINFQIPIGVTLPGNAVVPKEWSIFAIWQIGDDEMRRGYSQGLEIIWPDGNTFLKQGIGVSSDQPDWITVIAGLTTFPAGQIGKVVIRAWMDSNDERVSEVAETWVAVKHIEVHNATYQSGDMVNP